MTLSGGQKQRVAIARTILRDPSILVLDDSTSSVDMETEYLIQEALEAVMRGRTTFVVASRLRTIKSADQILVLDRGRIVERGTHASLLRQDGPYRRLYDAQLRDQEEFEAQMLVAAQPTHGADESGEADVVGRGAERVGDDGGRGHRGWWRRRRRCRGPRRWRRLKVTRRDVSLPTPELYADAAIQREATR